MMEAMQFNCIPSLKLSSRGRLFCSNGGVRYSRRCVVSPCIKNSDQDLSFQLSLIHCWIVSNGMTKEHVDTGAVLMQGFVNRDALASTISSKKATFYSRSRSKLWTKGETSMNFINICDIFLDCDRDSILYLGKPDGPSCHTGSETCYYTSVLDSLSQSQVEENILAMTTLQSLESTIAQRKVQISEPSTGKPSWTRRLLLDDKLLCSKIWEEAEELCRTLEDNEEKSRTASEMADVLYHAMVLLSLRNVKVEDVLEVLRHRFSRSGIEEKRSRKSQES